MSKINVLIIPSSSGMAITAIKSLKKDSLINVFTTDIDPLAPGYLLANKGMIVPSFDDPAFLPSLKELCREERIDIMIPAYDTILELFSERAGEFAEMGTEVIISPHETIAATRDKWKTYKALEGKVAMPGSTIDMEDIRDFPVFMKPRGGSGSVDAHMVRGAEELGFYYNKIHEPIIQEFLPGTEYTVDCLADRDGNLLSVIARKRLEIRSGLSTKAMVVENRPIREMATAITENMELQGPFFFQAKEDREGIPRLIEINARIAGTMCLSSGRMGIVQAAVRMWKGLEFEVPYATPGLVMIRYYEEIFVEPQV